MKGNRMIAAIIRRSSLVNFADPKKPQKPFLSGFSYSSVSNKPKRIENRSIIILLIDDYFSCLSVIHQYIADEIPIVLTKYQ